MHIDVPMLGTSLAIAALQTSEFFCTGRDPKALGSAHPRNAPYQAFRARDQYFVLAAGNDKLWRSVCDVAGAPELLEDPDFQSPKLRAANQERLRDALEIYFTQADASHWLAALRDAGVPCARLARQCLDQVDVEAFGHAGGVQVLVGGKLLVATVDQ